MKRREGTAPCDEGKNEPADTHGDRAYRERRNGPADQIRDGSGGSPEETGRDDGQGCSGVCHWPWPLCRHPASLVEIASLVSGKG